MKALIISHNPMSTQHSIGKTLLSLFSEFSKDELCQLYIHTGRPEKDVCSSFFQITDKDVLKGVLTRRVEGRRVAVTEEQTQEIGMKDAEAIYSKLYASSKKRNPDRELLRDLMWKLAPWYNRDLRQWLEEQKPTCIFAAIGSGKFLYEMALRISIDYSLPLYTYVCDDFYFMKPNGTMIGSVWKKMLMLKTKELMRQTSAIVSICQEMSQCYSEEFAKPAITIMTGTNYQVAEEPPIRKNVNTLRYFGKLSLNRYKSMAEICKEIDHINKEKGSSISVEIFCGGIDEAAKQELEGIASAKLFDFISGDEFKTTFFSSDALIHVEAFDEASVDRVKYSVSTKIADSLASGIPLFAYAPQNVASMKHLIRNNCAFVATSKDELKEKLLLLLDNIEARRKISENEISTARRHHDPKSVSRELHKLMSS